LETRLKRLKFPALGAAQENRVSRKRSFGGLKKAKEEKEILREDRDEAFGGSGARDTV
jgi:hypothetical protein